MPPGTELGVTVAQFFGVALTINFMASGGDFLKGLDHLFSGYDEGILQSKQGATCRFLRNESATAKVAV